LGISDATFGRGLIFCRNPSEHQPYIIISIYLDCRVQKNLLQNVLLRVTTAELGHPVKDWLHEIDGTGVFTSPMRQHRLGDRQSDGSNDLRDGSGAKTENAHGIEHSSRCVVASGRS
jgi:hypothetical protein